MEQQWRNKGGLGVAKWMEVEDGVEQQHKEQMSESENLG